jgi:excisionase family DNA binding protein
MAVIRFPPAQDPAQIPNVPPPPQRSLNLKEGALFLKVHKETLRRLLKSRQIPGKKVGRSWVMMEEDLVALVRGCQAFPGQASKAQETKLCSENVVTPGGWTSPHQTASALDALLAQRTSSRRRSCMTDSKPKRGVSRG